MYIDKNKETMKRFLDTEDIDLFYSGYVQMVNILYNECLEWLIKNIDAYKNLSLKEKKQLYQCKIFKDFLEYNNVTVNEDYVRNLAAIRNKLVHTKDSIIQLSDGTIGDFTDFNTISNLSSLVYESDCCVNFLERASKLYLRVELDKDTINSKDTTNDDSSTLEETYKQDTSGSKPNLLGELPDIDLGGFNNG